MGSSVLYSWALVQRVACAAATTPPDGRCKKTTLKGKIVSILSSVLQSGVQQAKNGPACPKTDLFAYI